MTNRDIRDIAGYVFAPFTFERYERNTSKPEWPYEWQAISGQGTPMFTALMLCQIGDKQEEVARNFKLTLRPIASLTYEEVRECALIDAGGDFHWGDVYQIERRYDRIVAYYGNGASVEIDYDGLISDGSASMHFAAIVAYLQSIAVWVPGTIDEKYVNLVE